MVEASDVAQETLLRTLEALRAGRIHDISAIPAFLFQTARHICMHRARSGQRESRALRRFAANADSISDHPLASLIREQQKDAVRLALGRLTTDDRSLLEMSYGEELDTAEIARRLGISEGAVRVRRHRAIRRLAEALNVTKVRERE